MNIQDFFHNSVTVWPILMIYSSKWPESCQIHISSFCNTTTWKNTESLMSCSNMQFRLSDRKNIVLNVGPNHATYIPTVKVQSCIAYFDKTPILVSETKRIRDSTLVQHCNPGLDKCCWSYVRQPTKTTFSQLIYNS